MSSLSEQERIGLEEVFLSISPSRNVLGRWPGWKKTLGNLMKQKRLFSPFLFVQRTRSGVKSPLNRHKITKLFNKIQKRRKF